MPASSPPTFSPAERFIFTLGAAAALRETVTVSSKRPLSNAIIAVIIFVVDAIANGSCSALPHNTRPVSASIKIAPWALTSGFSATAAITCNGFKKTSRKAIKMLAFICTTSQKSFYDILLVFLQNIQGHV
jgi:hypothetical protein